ncbi:E3 ubiquitin-protein ligase PDZRN3-B-like isoform X2 [Pomacea canaliculata]|nr:E3 ubiquitin-protein ligase PDZRN3-B-like isoform X2 [Pomacea canaliculata]
MVSIATQTEEEFYCYNRPPTPPQGFYPLHISGLYQPSSRRPVAFSPSAEMGLTDIEMAHNLDLDDCLFDDRQYEMVYEEVVLQRTTSNEKLGLTLCYGSLEDEVTDIFISEVDPSSVAGRDGRIKEGDQILQINGIDVHSRSEAISLFASQDPDIMLLVARPQLQMDDGFMEESNVVLEDLHMDLLEKHHRDNMQFMASMLARTHFDEEGGTTDTATTENSSHKHEKDSGVGRTDESTRNDESSEQEIYDADSLPPSLSKLRSISMGIGRMTGPGSYHHSVESIASNDPDSGDAYTPEIPVEECDKFRHLLEYRCPPAHSSLQDSGLRRKDSESSLERELAQLNREMEAIQVECQEIVEAHLKEQQRLVHQNVVCKDGHSGALKQEDTQRSPRVVPRMGTRLDCIKHMQALEQFDLWAQQRRLALATISPVHNLPVTVPSTVPSNSRVERDKDASTTSAYNTGESCRSTPLTLELSVASDESERGFKNSMLCLTPTPVLASSSDTEKQTQTPTGKSRSGGVRSREVTSEDAGRDLQVGGQSLVENLRAGLSSQARMGESLQDLYMRSADIMYTNHANLQHTIAVQQKLFQQQLEQQKRLRLGKYSPSSFPSSPQLQPCANVLTEDGKQQTPNTAASESGGQMEWVVKRRPDGTRYITRRPVRSKILKERAKKIMEERSGMTTDDDAMSELKTGRYWSKEERKRHLEKAKDYKRRKEVMMKARMETLKETEEKKEMNIVELSHRKMNKHKGKKVLDNFVTMQEMLAHGSRVPEGKTYNPLLSVTTV